MRLGMVLPVPLRNPVELANRVLTAHLVSGGRLVLGVGAGSARLTPWPAALGGPPVLVGSWASGRWITRAATELDGWVASAAKTSVRALHDGIARFRDAGGARAVVTNIEVDLAAAGAPLADDEAPAALRSLTSTPAGPARRTGDR